MLFGNTLSRLVLVGNISFAFVEEHNLSMILVHVTVIILAFAQLGGLTLVVEAVHGELGIFAVGFCFNSINVLTLVGQTDQANVLVGDLGGLLAGVQHQSALSFLILLVVLADEISDRLAVGGHLAQTGSFITDGNGLFIADVVQVQGVSSEMIVLFTLVFGGVGNTLAANADVKTVDILGDQMQLLALQGIQLAVIVAILIPAVFVVLGNIIVYPDGSDLTVHAGDIRVFIVLLLAIFHFGLAVLVLLDGQVNGVLQYLAVNDDVQGAVLGLQLDILLHRNKAVATKQDGADDASNQQKHDAGDDTKADDLLGEDGLEDIGDRLQGFDQLILNGSNVDLGGFLGLGFSCGGIGCADRGCRFYSGDRLHGGGSFDRSAAGCTELSAIGQVRTTFGTKHNSFSFQNSLRVNCTTIP